MKKIKKLKGDHYSFTLPDIEEAFSAKINELIKSVNRLSKKSRKPR
jgi:hypothetical protein